MLALYEVQVLGAVDEASRSAFLDLQLDVRTVGPLTVVSGELDQPGLHGLLERIRVHHLELTDVRRVRGEPDPAVDPAGHVRRSGWSSRRRTRSG